MTFPAGAAAVRHTDVAVERTLECDAGTVFHFNGGTPVDAADVFTETYSTAHRTLSNATYSAPSQSANTLVLTATAIAGKTASLTLSDSGTADAAAVADSLNQAQKDLGTAINTLNTNLAAAVTQLAALAADVLQLKKNVVAIVQDLKACGLQKTS